MTLGRRPAMTRPGHVFALLMALVLTGALPAAAEPTGQAEAASSTLTIEMPAFASDQSTVQADVTWLLASDDSPLDGEVELLFQRRGLDMWQRLQPVQVTHGVARLSLVPRDDGVFKLHWVGDEAIAAVDSAPVTFDNRPTVKLRLRAGQFNLPGADKLSKSTTRAAKAASLIKGADLDVVTFNELVGPGHNSTTNSPSSFARTVAKALGSKWLILTPSMSFNENYIAYRPDRMELIAQYPDRVVPGIGSGKAREKTARHVTPVLFKDRGSNQPVLIVATHLVNSNRAGARTQAYSVGQHASALSSGYPVVVAGDMNTSDQLTGLTKHALKDARRNAAKRTNGSYATYLKYSTTKPRKDATWIIDQIYVPKSWTVSRWSTVLGVKHGRFTSPRASDHMLVWTELAGPQP